MSPIRLRFDFALECISLFAVLFPGAERTTDEEIHDAMPRVARVPWMTWLWSGLIVRSFYMRYPSCISPIHGPLASPAQAVYPGARRES